MTYIELINNFWELDEDWQFTCCETRLYFYLLKTANRLGWVDSWTRSDAKVSSDVGVSVNSMKTARNRLEEELKKREAELGAQSDNPPSKPKKRPNPLNSEARKLFEERYQALFSSNYYWSAKDAGNMSSLLKKLKFQREKKNLPIDDQGVLNALKYLLDSITDGWILENFSVTNINSKFNEIVSQIMARKQEHGNTKHTDGAKAREQQTDREIMEYARSAFRKDVFGDS